MCQGVAASPLPSATPKAPIADFGERCGALGDTPTFAKYVVAL
jgi:hypothetical protein